MSVFLCSDTSRKPKKGDRESRMYAFTSRSKMEADIKNGNYLEHGEYDGNLYGLKIDSIHEVVEAGRVCILDANPQVCTCTTNLTPFLSINTVMSSANKVVTVHRHGATLAIILNFLSNVHSCLAVC